MKSYIIFPYAAVKSLVWVAEVLHKIAVAFREISEVQSHKF